MLDTVRLKILVTADEKGTIAGTAQALRYTPSAVSQQLAKLEREVGATLAIRTRTGIVLTTEGQELVKRARDILRRLEEAEQAVADVGQLRRGAVRVGSFTTAALTLVTPAITRMRAEHPGPRISLADVEPPGGHDDVLTGGLDILVSHAYPGVPLPEVPGLLRTPLMKDAFVAIVPARDAKELGRGPVTLERLADLPLISGRAGDVHRVAFDRGFERSAAEPRVEFETRDYAVTLALVAAGAGASIVPRSLVRRPDPGVRVLPLEPAEHRTIFALHRETSRNPALFAFLKFLQDAAAALSGATGTAVTARH
ncbi:LysR family transcriptional regulator [Actinomadura sp. NEAU-AAG7]|uniref:LysR family transcriptional regulator n=1 Tax=Actinomadura sp. NEAU-AAG7 TaxID=2839640 RepID=UPI001BE4D340|nr:LysR family transcriptional regulator [Actinomadura sp. NEAU-AAG7]MBT2208780.1 LysR family transcriptional regulator [Actinomadura sp. NEAU-AAG7]